MGRPGPSQLGAAVCPPVWGQQDIPQSQAVPMREALERTLRCGGCAQGLPGLGGISSRFPDRFSGFTSWFPARARCLQAFHPHHPHRCSPHPLLSRESLRHRRPLCIYPVFWGGCGQGLAVPPPPQASPLHAGRCSEELTPRFQGRIRSPSSPSLAAFPWRPPFPSRSGSAATGAALGVHRGPGGQRARPVPGPEPGKATAVPPGGAEPSGASPGSTAGSLGSVSVRSQLP